MTAKEALPILNNVFSLIDKKEEKEKIIKLLPSIIGRDIIAEKSAEFSAKVAKAEAFLDGKFTSPEEYKFKIKPNLK